MRGFVAFGLLSALCASTTACGGGSDAGETGESDPRSATVTHSFGSLALDSLEERELCGSWSLENDEAIYVNAVTLVNEGSWHHSNWFIVPEAYYEGPDGFWDCSERGFYELDAAAAGSVLFAQSTQSRNETMELNPGAVVKVPPRHRVVGGLHALNLAPRAIETELRMSLDIIHPGDVTTLLSPIRLTYYDLSIPPGTQSRFSSDCDMASAYEPMAGKPFDMKLHYITPHYHYLGDFFELSINGGARDGEVLFQLEGFNADGNGRQFFPPIDLTGSNGLSFTCGYDNWRDEEVGWGIGDQEMCVMLGLMETDLLMDNSVSGNSQVVDVVDDVVYNEGSCYSVAIPKSSKQKPPTEDEKNAPLYVPPSDAGDDGLPAVPECEDTPAGSTAAIEASLSAIRENIFVPACAFSSCHGQGGTASGLDLDATDLRGTLVNHQPSAETDMPLVDPGNPENSWLMKVIGECDPTTESGQVRNHMPRNAPTLLDPGLVAGVRDWIAAGAPDN